MSRFIILLIIVFSTFLQAQTPANIVKQGNYTVTGGTTLIATKSIVLKPNTHIKAGSVFRAYINQDAYIPVSLSNENYVYRYCPKLALL